MRNVKRSVPQFHEYFDLIDMASENQSSIEVNMDAKQLSVKFADSLLPVTVFYGILGGFGLISNAYVFYVYKYNYSRCNFRTFVLCLALVDFLSCLFVFPSEIYGHQIWFSYPPSAAWFCKMKTVLSGADVFMSSFVLLLIAIDRFKKVCRPLGEQMKVQTALRLCLMIFGIGMIVVIPCPILFGIQTSNITYEGEKFEVTSCMKDDEFKDSPALTIYVAIAYYSPVVTFMVITMVLYAMLIRKIFCGSFLNFEEKIPRTKIKITASVDGELNTSEEDVASASEADMTHDADEDINEISDIQIDTIELQSMDKQVNENEDGQSRHMEIQFVENRELDNISTNEIDRPIEGKKVSEKRLIRNDDENDKAIIETRNIKHAPVTTAEINIDKTEIAKKNNNTRNQDQAKKLNEHNMTVSNVDVKGRNKENRAINKEIKEKVNKGANKTNNPHKFVLNELKSLHRQNFNSLPMKNDSPWKRTFGKETIKRLKSQKVSRKRNIKTRSLIMFVVTLIFTITTSIYFCTFTVVYGKGNILDLVTPDFAAMFFLCWRIYFVNHVINPFVYGFLDPRFRKAIKRSSQNLYRRISKFKLSSFRRSINL